MTKTKPKTLRIKQRIELQRLRQFYMTIIRLTVDHDVIRNTACVTADKLDAALERVNPKWLG